jgi:hypothetical protein
VTQRELLNPNPKNDTKQSGFLFPKQEHLKICFFFKKKKKHLKIVECWRGIGPVHPA